MADTLNWGILATGGIANTFAKGLADSRTGRLVAVGSRTRESAERFGDRHAVPHRHASYEALLAVPDVQAVYICPPHPLHAEWAIKAADAGKHVLCEKPLTINYPTAMAVAEAAHRNGVFLMEAFMYRCHPQTARLIELVREGAIGQVRVICATFSFHSSFNLEGRLLNHALGGGGILDVGCYCTSMARLVAGVATGQPFAEPVRVQAAGKVGDASRVDEYAVAILTFPGDIVAQLSTGVQVNQDSVVRIYGTEGSILIPSPWFCSPVDGAVKIIVHRNGEPPREVVVETDRSLYAYEADAFAEGVQTGKSPYPAMSVEDTLSNMRTLDRWRVGIGMTYDCERIEGQTRPASGRKLAPMPSNNMRYGKVAGVEQPISRLVMGTMLEGAIMPVPHASALFDDFVERGGNAFDTAYVYGGGTSEVIFGNWVRQRGIRDQIVVIAKGAHTPYCTPEWLTKQLLESLERLQMECVDIYMLHRDNLEVPVGEFVDVLNEHVRAGRMRAFGGSNWTIERVQAANEYAAAHGLVGFAAVSNNLCLADMVSPVWDGCVASSDRESRDWFTKTQMPLFSWSSQGRGFFVRGNPNDVSDPELVRCWYSEANFRRLERAKELAARKGTTPINVAAAYVLCQPFPTFALIGPRSLSETRTSMPALDLQLTPEELAWLRGD